MEFQQWWDDQKKYIEPEFSETQLNEIFDNCRQSWNAARDTSVPGDTIIHVSVRWFDGYLEHFQCHEVRFGSDLLFIRLNNGQNRHIPVRQVRWYSINPESHEKTT